MKPNRLITLNLSIICCGAFLGAAAEPAQIDELPPEGCCDPIVVYRKVYLHETLSELGSRMYDKVDYELKIRTLTRDIRVAEAELVLQRDRVRVYDRDFGRTSALYLTRQNAKLDVLKSEEKLKLLRQEQRLALRHRNDQVRDRELLLSESAGRLQLAK